MDTGTLVWCKLSRFPWWPAVVVDYHIERAFVRRALPPLPAGAVLVRFLADGYYATVAPDKLRRFDDWQPAAKVDAVRDAVAAAHAWRARRRV